MTRRRTAVTAAVVVLLGVVSVAPSPHTLLGAPPAPDRLPAGLPAVAVSRSTFGHSGAVDVRTTLPGAAITIPLELSGDTVGVQYAWEHASDSLVAGAPRPLTSDTLTAPAAPGFYRLTLLRGGSRAIVSAPTLAVLVPFARKRGPTLDGYRLGTYPAERLRATGAPEPPRGFVRVRSDDADLALSQHLRLSEFLPHDGQTQWPRFVAIDPRVIDKLELVLARLARRRPIGDLALRLSVHSGFRPPAYNRHVPHAARDSQHEYGDAIDVAIDADGNGRYDRRDVRLVAAAVNAVEAKYPDLVGGMGLYTSHRFHHPYVHIDARGTRVRWHG